MKILLVAMNAKYVHSNLAIYNLKAYANTDAVALAEFTINHNLDTILMEIYKTKAEVVAFSCYIWNIAEVLSISCELKKVNPKVKIWVGGPEVSYDANEILSANPQIDVVMVGEGEVTFKEAVLAHLSGSELSKIAGLYTRSASGEIVYGGMRPLLLMDDVPFVYEDFSKFKNKIIYYESSRGCPFSCSYCLSSIDKSVRFRSLDLVFKELQLFLDEKVPQVKFIDRTFNCKKEHSRAIWQYLVDHDNGVTNFHFEISADLLSDEDIEIFKLMRPGLIQLEIGLQSTHPETIDAIKRKMDLKKLAHYIGEVKKLGNIHQHLDLIAGLPMESLSEFKKSFDDAFAMRPDQLQLGFLKVLKGSYMHEMKDAYGLLYHLDPPYEVMETKWLSFADVIALKQIEEVLEVYYNSDQFTNSLSYLLSFYDSAYAFFEALADYYARNNLFQIAHKRMERYEILFAFAKEIDVEIDLSYLSDLLLHDLYLRENIKKRPSFASSEEALRDAHKAFFDADGDDRIRKFYPEHKKLASQMMHLEQYKNNGEETWILYDYRERNPLNNAAKTVKV